LWYNDGELVFNGWALGGTKMSSVEERLAKVEREIEVLRGQRNTWPIAQVDEKFKGDEILQEVFRLGKEDREMERKKAQE
jgi:hypothetical protein